MLNLKIKEKTLQEHREDAVNEFKIIQKRLILKKNETFEMEELEEIKEAIEELNVYIDFIDKSKIFFDDNVYSIIGKSYIIFQSVPKVIEVLKQINKEYQIPYSEKFNENYIRMLLSNSFNCGIPIYLPVSYNKAFNFAREIYLRKGYKLGYKDDWKSTSWVVRHIVRGKESKKKK